MRSETVKHIVKYYGGIPEAIKTLKRERDALEDEYNGLGGLAMDGIAFTYWIGDGDQRSAGTIQEKVTAAVQSYQSWQRHLGRDINPTELIAKIREAGAKRVKLTAPADIVVGRTQLPKCTGQTVTYGGLEDD